MWTLGSTGRDDQGHIPGALCQAGPITAETSLQHEGARDHGEAGGNYLSGEGLQSILHHLGLGKSIAELSGSCAVSPEGCWHCISPSSSTHSGPQQVCPHGLRKLHRGYRWYLPSHPVPSTLGHRGQHLQGLFLHCATRPHEWPGKDHSCDPQGVQHHPQHLDFPQL